MQENYEQKNNTITSKRSQPKQKQKRKATVQDQTIHIIVPADSPTEASEETKRSPKNRTAKKMHPKAKYI
jgi:hypothetical protein